MQKKTKVYKIVTFGMIWGILILILSVILEPTPENLTLAVSISLSGLYTVFLFLTRKIWLPRLSRKPIRNAVILGSINAAVIETLFLIVEKIFGAEGVAAHPNLLIDLVLTMPWYIGMVWIFVRVQRTEQFSPAAVLFLGAVYELGADGVVGGQILGLIMGQPVNLLTSWFFLLIAAFWQFIPVYSSMVLPPSWILESIQPDNQDKKSNWRKGLRPLIMLIPFTIYLIFLMLILGSAGI